MCIDNANNTYNNPFSLFIDHMKSFNIQYIHMPLIKMKEYESSWWGSIVIMVASLITRLSLFYRVKVLILNCILLCCHSLNHHLFLDSFAIFIPLDLHMTSFVVAQYGMYSLDTSAFIRVTIIIIYLLTWSTTIMVLLLLHLLFPPPLWLMPCSGHHWDYH